MSRVETLEREIRLLPREEARQLQEWLADYLEDQETLSPGFVRQIEEGKRDLAVRAHTYCPARVEVRQATEVYARSFDEMYFALAPAMRAQIEAKIADLGRRLETFPHHRLQGREEYRLRVGDYRVIYEFDTDRNELYLIALGHRREVYR